METKKIENMMVGKFVVVRAEIAGVHAGEVVMCDFKTNSVVLKNARRMWGWETRDTTGSLSDIAANGLCKGKSHQIGATVPSTTVTNPRGLEMCEFTEHAWASVRDYA